LNAFVTFCKRYQSVVSQQYPNLDNESILKILDEWWQTMGSSEKRKYYEQEVKVKSLFIYKKI